MAKKPQPKKPVNSRAAFKKSAAYIKPKTVGPNEKGGGKYREKLRQRQSTLTA